MGVAPARLSRAGRNINKRVTEYVANRDIESDDRLGARIFPRGRGENISTDGIQKQWGTLGAPTSTLDSWEFPPMLVKAKQHFKLWLKYQGRMSESRLPFAM